MQKLRASLVVLAVAPVAWLVGALVFGDRTYVLENYALALVLMAAGLGLSAWAVPAERRLLGGTGFAVAALGLLLFYDFDFFGGLAQRAGGVVFLGLMISAVAVWADTLRGLAAGMAVVFVGCAIWVRADWAAPADFGETLAWIFEWEFGNVVGLFGAAFSSVAAFRRG